MVVGSTRGTAARPDKENKRLGQSVHKYNDLYHKVKLSVKGKGNKRRRSELSPPPAGSAGETLAT